MGQQQSVNHPGPILIRIYNQMRSILIKQSEIEVISECYRRLGSALYLLRLGQYITFHISDMSEFIQKSAMLLYDMDNSKSVQSCFEEIRLCIILWGSFLDITWFPTASDCNNLINICKTEPHRNKLFCRICTKPEPIDTQQIRVMNSTEYFELIDYLNVFIGFLGFLDIGKETYDILTNSKEQTMDNSERFIEHFRNMRRVAPGSIEYYVQGYTIIITCLQNNITSDIIGAIAHILGYKVGWTPNKDWYGWRTPIEWDQIDILLDFIRTHNVYFDNYQNEQLLVTLKYQSELK